MRHCDRICGRRIFRKIFQLDSERGHLSGKLLLVLCAPEIVGSFDLDARGGGEVGVAFTGGVAYSFTFIIIMNAYC